jgi:hypothetical protein
MNVDNTTVVLATTITLLSIETTGVFSHYKQLWVSQNIIYLHSYLEMTAGTSYMMC